MNPKVDWFFDKDQKWQPEFSLLRKIILDCGLTEELKWGVPCYTLGTKNIVLIHGLKEYCALLFFKGALLKDPHGILVRQTANVQGPRQVRFTTSREIEKLKSVLKAYVREAIAIQKTGVKLDPRKTAEIDIPEEFRKRLSKSAALKKAFSALTPGRQRAYILYFSSAKQSSTRAARVDKHVPRILVGKGLDD